jgi:protein Mpv17
MMGMVRIGHTIFERAVTNNSANNLLQARIYTTFSMRLLAPCTSIVIPLLAVPISATVAFAPYALSTTANSLLARQSSILHASTFHPNLWRKLRGGDQEEVAVVEEADSFSEPLLQIEEETPPAITMQKSEDFSSSSSSPPTKNLAMMATPVMALLTTASKFYSQQLEQSPIVTKSCTAGVIFALSDYLAQRLENKNNKDKKEPFNYKRFSASTLVGLLYFGPAAHYWYDMIFKLLPGTGILSTLYKAFWGQAIFGPLFTCIFFATSLLQAGTFSLGNWASKIKTDLPGAWLAGASFWPLVDLVSYSVVPVKYIPLFVNMCSLVWTIYLSTIANRSRSKTI